MGNLSYSIGAAASALLSAPERVRACSERFPERVAIEENGQVISYLELLRRVEALRWRLASVVAPASVVAVVAHRSSDAIVAALAVWSAGCVLMNIDEGLPEERQRLMMNSVAPAATLRCVGTVEIERAATVPQRFAPVDADHAYVAFTSGSTGRPKAILGSHRGLSHFLQWQGSEFEIGPGDRFAHLTNLSFDVWFRDAFTPLTHGATLCIPAYRHLGARDLFDFMEAHAITAMHAVPSVTNYWLHSASDRAPIASMRLTFFAGEPLEGVLVRRWRARFPSCQVVNLYGPTETTLARHFKRIAPQPLDGVQSVGYPIPGSATHILDDALRPCAENVVGEICIETSYRSHGYLLETGLHTPFVDVLLDGAVARSVYRTGDLGLRRPDGEIEIRGRRDDQVKVNGVRIELLEVKSAIASFSGVRDVFVCVVDESCGRSLVAVLEAQADVISPLMANLRRCLPAVMLPTRFLTLHSLPRLPNGKLDRAELTLLAIKATPPMRHLSPQRPSGATVAQRLESLWRQVLRADSIEHHRNFFESGGNSLKIVELHARIEDTFQVRLPLVRLFEHVTLASQAAMLSEGVGSNPQSGAGAAPHARLARQAVRASTLGTRHGSVRQPAVLRSERHNPDA